MRRYLAAACAVGLLFSIGAAQSADYFDTPDVAHATPEIAAFFAQFFRTKSNHDVAGTMAFFSPEVVTYTDATLGWPLNGYLAIGEVFKTYMPKWGEGKSYATRVLGGPDSALVAFTDTPELFGGELRILGAVDLEDGKIVRWVDYWDSSSFDDELYDKLKTPPETFPTDYRETAVRDRSSERIGAVATALQAAFAAEDSVSAARLLSYDVVYEDLALHAHVAGRAAVERYLSRVLAGAPFGDGATLRHVVGGDLGGGFEWIASPTLGVKGGITALTLDEAGLITRITTVYDGRLLGEERKKALVLGSIEP